MVHGIKQQRSSYQSFQFRDFGAGSTKPYTLPLDTKYLSYVHILTFKVFSLVCFIVLAHILFWDKDIAIWSKSITKVRSWDTPQLKHRWNCQVTCVGWCWCCWIVYIWFLWMKGRIQIKVLTALPFSVSSVWSFMGQNLNFKACYRWKINLFNHEYFDVDLCTTGSRKIENIVTQNTTDIGILICLYLSTLP